jgi:hypothetical protein
MKLCVAGIGMWADDMPDWEAFDAALGGRQPGSSDPVESKPPEALVIPARERRRVPFIARMAVAVASQACEMADVAASDLATVFSSAMGDTNLTDYMCRALAEPPKVMSPTKFHNSVHNATSGYWSIFTHSRLPGGFVGALRDSFAAGFMEASVLAVAEGRNVLLVVYDIKDTLPLHGACPIDHSLAYSFVITAHSEGARGREIEVSLQASADPTEQTKPPVYNSVGNENPVADGLALVAGLRDSAQSRQLYSLGNSFMQIDVAAGSALID